MENGNVIEPAVRLQLVDLDEEDTEGYTVTSGDHGEKTAPTSKVR